jgi:hypothetical protein
LAAGCPSPNEAVEVTQTVTQGSERELREDGRRPIRGTTRVLVLAFDGVGRDSLREAIESGRMPRLASITGAPRRDGSYEHAWADPQTLSILPSTTVAAWTSIFTGRPPAESGVAGNEFFAREDQYFWAPAPVSVPSVAQTMDVYNGTRFQQLIAVETLYEQVDVRSHVSLSHVHRGADTLTMPGASSYDEVFLSFLGGTLDRDDGRALYGDLDRSSVDSLLEQVEEGIPDLQTVYFPGIDLYTHVAPDPLEEMQKYLQEVTDPEVGRILDAWEEAGALDDTYVVVVSDHGHTPVRSDDRHSLDASGDDEPPAVLEALGFRMRPNEEGESDGNYTAAIAYQGAFAYIYLADRSVCTEEEDECNWNHPPRMEEDVLAVARAFHEASERGARVPAMRGTIDLIFAREPQPPSVTAGPFMVFDGRRLVPIAQYLARHPRRDLLRLEERLRGLAEGQFGHRAGDVLLLSRTGGGRPIDERFYFSGPYESWHGSPAESDSAISFVVAHRGKTGAEIARYIRPALSRPPSQLDVTPVVVRLLEEER